MHLAIIGGGRAAWAFGLSWLRAGWPVDGIEVRAGSTSPVPKLLGAARLPPGERILSDVVLVAVPDDALPAVCADVAGRCADPSWLVHPSGSHDSTLFGSHVRAFSLHPLRALSLPGEGDGLADSLLVFEGPDEARATAARIAEQLGARMAVVARERKLAYHAAAVIAANLVAAQLDLAARLIRDAGVDVPGLESELAGLARSAVDNWAARDGAARFTGPIARGDVRLVRAHLDHLAEDADASTLYRAASLVLCRRLLAERPDDPALCEIERLLSSGAVP